MAIRLTRKTCAVVIGFCITLSPAIYYAEEPHGAHWAYGGTEGPEHWSSLDSAFATCGVGQHQSPINITHAKLADLPELKFDYNAVPLSIVDNGHTIMINYAPGSTLTVGNKIYALKQFHFHHPSEEQIDGKGFDLDAHLVHADADGHLAVVAVLFKAGAANPLLETLWKNIPSEKGKTVEIPAVSVNIKDLLPAQHGYYSYSGSLTTPPCSEGVSWYVLKSAVSLSNEQLASFGKVYPHNSRPTQKLAHRQVLESK